MPEHETFILEKLGSTILEPLLTATKHDDAVVREGAVLGLDKAVQLALARLKEMAESDSSSVREVAQDALEGVIMEMEGDARMSKLEPIQWALAHAMSQASEDAYCAGWLIGLEYILWEALLNPHIKGENWAPEVLERVRKLSELCDGWIYWDEEVHEETFIPMKEWLERYAKR